MDSKNVGNFAENYVKEYLLTKGHIILDTNYHSRYGEIDIITQSNDTICFVEVKSRKTDGQVTGLAAVTRAKQKKIILTALCYLEGCKDELQPRFDVCSVTHNKSGAITDLDYLEAAFDGSCYQ